MATSGVSVVDGVAATNGSDILAQSYVSTSCPADITEDILATINLPANTLGVNGAMRIKTMWSCTSSANNKTFRIRLGGIGGTLYMQSVVTAVTTALADTLIANTGVANSQVGGTTGVTSASAIMYVVNSGAIDTSVATTVVITGQKALAGETLSLVGYTVEILK